MTSFKTSNKNLDSKYVYKVEEIQEDEKITHTSPDGEISTSSRTRPKVTRYFIRNDEGESQGYYERKFNPNSETDHSCKKSTNPTYDNDPFVFCKEDNTTFFYQPAFKCGQRSRNDEYKFNYRDHLKCDAITELDEFVCNNKSIYTLDYTSSNSTPTENLSYGIKHLTSSTDPMTVIGPKRKRKIGVKTKKSSSLFCKDPNERLKNLFTIIKSKEKSTETLSDNTISSNQEHNDAMSLTKTKELLVNLIDKELQRIQLNSNSNANKNIQQKQIEMKALNNCALKTLRLECMRKIEDELRLLKRLVDS